MRVGCNSFAVILGEGLDEIGCGRAIVVPLRMPGGRVSGVIAVCADAMLSVPRRVVEEAVWVGAVAGVVVEEFERVAIQWEASVVVRVMGVFLG